MRSLLSQRYFVPVLRPIDLSSPARIGKPWSPDVTPKSPESLMADSPLVQKYVFLNYIAVVGLSIFHRLFF